MVHLRHLRQWIETQTWAQMVDLSFEGGEMRWIYETDQMTLVVVGKQHKTMMVRNRGWCLSKMHFIIFHLFNPTKVYTWDRTADRRNTFHLRQVTFLRDFLDSWRPCLILMQAGNVSSATNLRSPGYSKSVSQTPNQVGQMSISFHLSLSLAGRSRPSYYLYAYVCI